jgi:hypothetical protein
MTYIKRPNYFTYQFLVEKDFQDEQAYHRDMRYRHNRELHSWGVIGSGLNVEQNGNTSVKVTPGMAIDKDGREIILLEDTTYDLGISEPGITYLTIKFDDQSKKDNADRYTTGGLDKYTRVIESPILTAEKNPAQDGSVIVLAAITVANNGQIGNINNNIRRLATAAIAPGSIDTTKLAPGSVNQEKLNNQLQITLNNSTAHIANKNNPHEVTAAQIDNQGGTNRIVEQINAGTGIIKKERIGIEIDPTILNRLNSLEDRLNQLRPSFASSPNQFNPKQGQPGTTITLSGKNFNIGTSIVRFGNQPATIVGTPTANEITVQVPNLPAGTVTISVETAAGTVVSNDTFTVILLPAFASSPNQFSPKSGVPGTNVTLFGNNFNGTTSVRFGIVATTFTVQNNNQIVARVPQMAASNNVKITVQTVSGTVTSTDNFSVLATYYGSSSGIGSNIL